MKSATLTAALIVAVIFAGCSVYGAWDYLALFAPTDMSGYSFRHEITFNNSAQVESLSAFPALIVLIPARVDYGDMKADGSDIRFIDGNTRRVIPHEMEAWNYGGTSLIWVQVKTIDGGSDSDGMWLYYGSDNPPPAADEYDVWDSGFIGVWHLDDLDDSTPNANNGNDAGTVAASGVIGQAREFTGTEYIRILETPALDITGALTLEAWAYKRATTDQVILAKTQYPGDNRSYAIGFDYLGLANGPYIELSDDGLHKASGFEEAPGSEASDMWMHIAGVFNGTTVALYVNGVKTGEHASVASLFLNDRDLIIGAGHDGGSNNIDGYIDEVRISDMARTSDWIAAQYLSMTDAFVTYGEKETL